MLGRVAVLLAALGAATVVAAAGAVAAVRASAPLPALSSLVLAPGDFRPGASIASQATSSQNGRQLFIRLFKPGASFSGAPLLGAVSMALLEPDASTAGTDFAQVNDAAKSVPGRQALAKEWALDFVKGADLGSRGKVKITVTHSAVGPPVEIGPSALRLPLTLKTNHGTLRISLEVAQTDRVVAIVELVARFNHELEQADAATALKATQQHLTEAFAVKNTTAPTINGSATQGQVILVDEGAWAGAPSSFSYAWSRCDVNGANCLPIDGATGISYSPGPADAGSTLRITVTGANSTSSQQVASAATAAVS